jgi:hypothetical protein
MAGPTQVAIIVSNGDNTVSTVTINIPPGVDVNGFVMTLGRVGFWDSNQQNYFPASAIRKISPA